MKTRAALGWKLSPYEGWPSGTIVGKLWVHVLGGRVAISAALECRVFWRRIETSLKWRPARRELQGRLNRRFDSA